MIIKKKILDRYLAMQQNYNVPLRINESLSNNRHLLLKDADSRLNASLATIKNRGQEPGISQQSIELLTSSIENEGKQTLTAFYKNNLSYFATDNNKMDLLEVIVQTDGTRPSFLIANGTVDLGTSPTGQWSGALSPTSPELQHSISCVGRINKYGTHIGTGFLIGPNLIMTNRHVLQLVASQSANGLWTLHEETLIDFGYELNGMASLNPRELVKVVYAGPQVITAMDHNKLDIALIEIKSETENPLPDPLQLITSYFHEEMSNLVYAIGYPGNPGHHGEATYGTGLLQALYSNEYGFKRLSPGGLISGSAPSFQGRLCHDASTLGGSSGSLVVFTDRVDKAAAIHYGGSLGNVRENYAHFLQYAITKDDKLRESFVEYNVVLI